MSGSIDKFIGFDTGYADFQIDYFISGKSGKTAYGVYKQACLEMQTRYYNLFDLHCEIEVAKEDLEKEEHPIKKMQYQMRIKGRQKQIAKSEREIKRFYQQAEYLDREYGFSGMTHDQRETEEYKMWVAELEEKVGCELATTGGVSTSTLMHIRNCPPKIKDAVLPKCFSETGRNQLKHQFANESNYQLPDNLPTIEYTETRLIDFIKENDNE